jgi:outer membrane protein OmpA-like peptidoglycan-associated protein
MMIFQTMSNKLVLGLLLFMFTHSVVFGQDESYIIAKAPMSSDRFDEFCPVYYKNGLVFCSNRDLDVVNKYSTLQGKSFIKILYIDTSANSTGQNVRLFSKALKTKLNDGPVTFSHDWATVYFSRNIYTEGNSSDLSSPRNKLGLFSSEYEGDWKKPHDFRYNNEWYNITAPCLSPDGSHLFFASDKTGGYGGTDLYYCVRENDYWGAPVNMGPLVNTSGNESYPFMCKDGELFFSSDGHGGLGGKDIYFTKYIDSVWREPVHLNAPINSKYDDFGLITDPVMKNGYFSSNRDGSYDIFSFTTTVPQLFYPEEQKVNEYCYRFKNGERLESDTSNMVFEWDFGDSKMTFGKDVEHCFPGPGTYNVQELIIGKQTGQKIFTKQQFTLEIKEIEQPFISSDDCSVAGEYVDFDARKSNVPGQTITEYIWDFGDGVIANSEAAKHSYKTAGEYKAILGLMLKNNKTGEMSISSAYKVIRVFNNVSEKNAFISNNSTIRKVIPEVTQYDHAFITNRYQSLSDNKNSYLFEVQLFTSKNHIDSGDNIFRNLSNRYFVKEIYQPESGIYSYIVSEESSFLRSYQILKNIVSLGFKDAVIQTRVLTSPEEKDLYNLKIVYGSSADSFFGRLDSRLTSAGFAYLDQIVILLNRYPGANLLIESHTNRAGNSNANLLLSVQRAEAVASYIANHGININRLLARGYGDTRPLSLNNSEEEKKFDQRIDLMLVK